MNEKAKWIRIIYELRANWWYNISFMKLLEMIEWYKWLLSFVPFQPPIQVFGIEGRYATALYSAASKEKKLDAVETEVKSLQVVNPSYCIILSK